MKAQSPLFEQSALQAKVMKVVNVMWQLGLQLLFAFPVFYIKSQLLSQICIILSTCTFEEKNVGKKEKIRPNFFFFYNFFYFLEKTVLDRILTRFLA